MHLTTHSDYALRTLIYLAAAPERRARIADIAAAYDISENHLMKIVHRLGLAGYVETVRGRHGGLQLAAPAAAINLGAVIRSMEPDFDIVPCLPAPGICRIESSCILKGVLGEAVAAFLAVLDRHTLADLTAPARGLPALLGLAETPARVDTPGGAA